MPITKLFYKNIPYIVPLNGGNIKVCKEFGLDI